MLLALALLAFIDEPTRTPAIYRCPAKDALTEKFQKVVEEDSYDSICVDPKASAAVKAIAKGKVAIVLPSTIDTAANLKWRNATIDFVNAKISPKQWVARTANLHETIHFLSSPHTPELRAATPSMPMDGTYSARSVFAELFLLSLPGRPCLTAGDVWATRELPDAGRLQSWVLAMNDFLGPNLYWRHETPFLVTGKMEILRADAKPGLLIYRVKSGKHTITLYFNNDAFPVTLPKLDTDKVTMNHGLNLDGPKPTLVPAGTIAIEEGAPK